MNYLSDKYTQMGYMGIIVFVVILFGIIACVIFLRKKRSVWVMRLASMTHSAYGHLLLAAIGIFWASSVSVFGTQLQKQWFDGEVWGFESLFFAIPVTFALVLSVLHYIYSQHKEHTNQTRASYNAVNENGTQCINMLSVINSCVQDLRKIMQAETHQVGSILGNEDLVNSYNDTLDSAIDTVQESILKVTHRFLEGNDDVTIKSNLFSLVPTSSLLNTFQSEDVYKQENHSIFSKNAVVSSPFFLFSSNLQSRLEHCDHVLICEQQFTCELNKKYQFSNCYKNGKNSNSYPICMPFSTIEEVGKIKHPNLFGAPEAVITAREVYIKNIQECVDTYLNRLKKSPTYREHLTGVYEQDIRKYYEKDKDRTKSILSVPIGKLDIDCNTLEIPIVFEEIAGVINIYVDRVNFLENEIKSEVYYSTIKPLCHNLSVLMSLKILYSKLLNSYNLNDNEKEDNYLTDLKSEV